MARASRIAASATSLDPTERLKACIAGTIGRTRATGLEDVVAINRVIDDYVEKTGDDNVRRLDAIGDLEGAEIGLDAESRDLDWHGPVEDIIFRVRMATESLQRWFDETVPLVGYSAEPGWGLSVPLFGAGDLPDLVARRAVSGPSRGNVVAFEAIEEPDPELTVLLPANQRPRLRVGYVWHEVFVWDQIPYVGPAPEVWRRLEPVRDDIRERAPMSLLDLAIQIGDDEKRQAARDAMAFVAREYGEDRADRWRRSFLSNQIRDALVAELPDLNPDENEALYRIGLDREPHGTVVSIPDSILAKLGPDGWHTRVCAALRPLAEGMGVTLTFPFDKKDVEGPGGPS